MPAARRKRWRGSALASLLLAFGTVAVCVAEPAAPSLINPRLRIEPGATKPPLVRFLATDNDPPFSFAGPDGALVGYAVDLAREICGEMKLACTIQARRADTLTESLVGGAGDAVIPAPVGASDPRLALSLPFLPRPGRFAVRQSAPMPQATVEGLANRTVGAVEGSAHATFLARFFPTARAQTFPSTAALLEALGGGAIDLVFADGVELAFWLNGVAANGCCTFVPGAFLDPALFGAGFAIATRVADDDIRRTLDSALTRLTVRGTMTELYLRYFPVPLF